MLLVILGAGASFDSAPSLHPSQGGRYRPPLANGLFDGREIFRQALMRYRQCQPIITYLRGRGSRSLEQVLQELSDSASKISERPRQLLAVRYYIRDIIQECSKNWIPEVSCITTHKTLVDQILECAGERVLFVTFNYDELLEDALSDHGFKTNDLKHYIHDHHQFCLYKLHGSIKWVRFVWHASQYPIARTDLIDKAAQLKLDAYVNGFGIIPDVNRDELEGLVGIPAIAIPIHRKLAFECPSEHVEHLCKNLGGVDKILVIGWQGREDNFTDLLKEHLRDVKKLQVVSVEDATATMDYLRFKLSPKLDLTECTSFQHGFSKFVEQRAGMFFDL